MLTTEVQFPAVLDELSGMVNGLTQQDMYDAWHKLAAKDGANHLRIPAWP